MQYHLEGFRPGSPDVKPAADNLDADASNVDVLIVGCGPAGLTLAAQLSAFPEISTRIVDQKSGPLEVGQADGIACRSMEMFEAFGFAEKVEREAYWVNETCFWRPSAEHAEIRRADRIQDVEDGLSEFPHTILNQARIHDFFLEVMRNSPRRLEPDYGRHLMSVVRTDDPEHPVTATFERLDNGSDPVQETINARYLVGCDGARSVVRKSLGHALKGESARQLWGVMDILAVTDFPDIRLKCAIQSQSSGSLLIIPREGGYMVRMYIELDELADQERASDRNVTPELLIKKAQAILAPYTLDAKEVAWWSAYEIGQRVCDGFDDVPDQQRDNTIPRMFIAGDACHTHSPKAGQGMNVSMADSFNLGWKLASVILGQARPELLHTYSEERRAKAKELIDFDRDMARLFSAKPRDGSASQEFQSYFSKHARYTAGVETRYQPSAITGSDAHQALAAGFVVGTRFHSAPVIRLADAKPMQLGHTIKADGRWRMFLFAGVGDRGQADGPVAELCNFLATNPSSPLPRFSSGNADIDNMIDVRAVFQQAHQDLAIEDMPSLLLPAKGRYGLTDYEKMFCPDLKNGQDIFDMRKIDRSRGAMVVTRPDQYVAQILPLNDTKSLTDFFERIMHQPN
ncbi:MAG: FAD-binding monooxygenase [Pseudomonadota bacterium]